MEDEELLVLKRTLNESENNPRKFLQEEIP